MPRANWDSSGLAPLAGSFSLPGNVTRDAKKLFLSGSMAGGFLCVEWFLSRAFPATNHKDFTVLGCLENLGENMPELQEEGAFSVLSELAGRQESCVPLSLGKGTAPSRGVFLKVRVRHGRGFCCEKPGDVGEKLRRGLRSERPLLLLKSGGARPGGWLF